MSNDAVSGLIARFERARSERNASDALAALHDLQKLQPEEPTWPKRIAEIHAAAKHPEAELKSLLRALELQIDREQTVRAIATAKRILSIEPNHSETEDRLHLLYTIPATSSNAAGAAGSSGAGPEILVPKASANSAPLDEIVLTEVVANTRRVVLADPDQTGAAEIPLDPNEATQELELFLDTLAPNAELDVDTSCLAKPGRHSNDEQALRAKLFTTFSGEEIDQLMAQSEIVEIPAGVECFHQGDRADRMYVILEGSMSAVVEDSESEHGEVGMGVLEAGDFFGEIGLVTRQPRNASIRALAPTRLLAIDQSAVRNLLRAHREVFGLVLRTLRFRLVDRLVRTSPIFSCFARATRSEVAKQFRLLEVRDGTTIIREGIPDQGVFVVLAGHVEISQSSQDGEKVLASLSHGDVFGEQSVLLNQPAVATATARGKCWLFALSESRFAKIMASNPRLREMLLSIGEHRTRENRRAYLDQQNPEHR
ncbi:MAG: cyclic nucleotide-binding domain-containing protein [Myxococcales bacterium]|nr:cyclic nucleotide-binding domain-containing protein [Myxococcales bacterium]